MKQVGITEAKRLFPQLLAEVEQGASIVITRRGKAVARMVKEHPPGKPPETVA